MYKKNVIFVSKSLEETMSHWKFQIDSEIFRKGDSNEGSRI